MTTNEIPSILDLPRGRRMIFDSAKRIKNTRNGNPRFEFTTIGGYDYRTAVNASFTLELPMWGDLTGEWMVEVGGRGTIVGMARLPERVRCHKCGKVLEATTAQALRANNILFNHPAAGPCVTTETEMSS